MRCDIIIPIYNAIEYVQKCVESVRKNTDLINNGLILIDDKSPDDRIKEYLNQLNKEIQNENITILYNEQNLGFVGTVNKGMQYSKNDVLLLNSDTEVSENWLDNMKKCAYSESNVATVTALSNNATLASVPIGLQANNLPDNLSFEDYARAVSNNSIRKYPQIPTAHGFCMYIRRNVLDNVGYFDAETFGKGYGEENDFSYRCMDYGYKHLLCDDVIIYHKESQSFTDSKKDLIDKNLKILKDRYPSYVSKTDLWLKHFPIKDICQNVKYTINLANKQNILFVIHDWSNIGENVGGTTLHCMDLISSLRHEYNIHVLAPEGNLYKVHSYFKEDEEVLNFKRIHNNIGITNLYDKEYGILISKILDGLNIDIIHIHHMKDHYFDIIDIAKEKGIKTIYTIHDFYCLCPSINMLYNMEECCLDSKQKNCKECLKNKFGINNDVIGLWQSRWNEFLSKVDLILTPSKSTKEIVENIYDNIDCRAIEHGINITKQASNLSLDDKMNIAFVGVMAKHKGAEIVQSLIKDIKDGSITFHLFGDSEYSVLKKESNNYKYHGKYKREELPKLLNDNKIHLVCNLSIWPETYSYTLTETISCGVPVLSYDIGAVAERINKNGFGWTVPINSSIKELEQYIIDLKNDKEGYKKIIDNLNNYKIKSTDDMASDYKKIYDVNITRENYKIGKLISAQTNEENNTYSANLDEILNSRRWKLVSKIQLPDSIKKVARKIIK